MHSIVPRRYTISSSTRLFSSTVTSESIQSVAIIGGGLAGLSTAYHLLQKKAGINITIIDEAEPGLGGASSVAGGLLHPLSPRGKLVHLGLEGIASTNNLISSATKYEEGTVLRDEILRLAVSEEHVSTLKKTATNFPSFTQWLSPEELNNTTPGVKGALRLHSSCKVVHVPTYLSGLWKACQSLGSGEKIWKIDSLSPQFDRTLAQELSSYDAVVLAAGAGLFRSSIIENGLDDLPVMLVRGQSVELKLPNAVANPAMLCGKYISPLPDERRISIGATHEFKESALTSEEVESELKQRTVEFAPDVWAMGTVDNIIGGFRVQSNRGRFGRLPIVGSIQSNLHRNAWVFTGLSSRGLLYHGVFGDLLSDLILGIGDVEEKHPEIHWWKRKIKKPTADEV